MNKKSIVKAVLALKDALSKQFGSETRLILFGSAARGDYDKNSDIDVLVLINGAVNNEIEERVFNCSYDVELENNVVFGIVVYSGEFWDSPAAHVMPLHKTIDREGVAQ